LFALHGGINPLITIKSPIGTMTIDSAVGVGLSLVVSISLKRMDAGNAGIKKTTDP
jgi:hypothetical protein